MDIARIKKKYALVTPFYDPLEAWRHALRVKAVGRLNLHPGSAVLDLGCGTGLSFDLLEKKIGPQGRIFAVDVSCHMLARARARIAHSGWKNITIIEANAEEFQLRPGSVDAVLCIYTHDILQSPRAAERVASVLRFGGCFVGAGEKTRGGRSGFLMNRVTSTVDPLFISDRSGRAAPWSRLEGVLGSLQIEEYRWGRQYIARCVKGGGNLESGG